MRRTVYIDQHCKHNYSYTMSDGRLYSSCWDIIKGEMITILMPTWCDIDYVIKRFGTIFTVDEVPNGTYANIMHISNSTREKIKADYPEYLI